LLSKEYNISIVRPKLPLKQDEVVGAVMWSDSHIMQWSQARPKAEMLAWPGLALA